MQALLPVWKEDSKTLCPISHIWPSHHHAAPQW